MEDGAHPEPPGNRVQLHVEMPRPAALRRAHGTLSAVGSRSPARSIRGNRLVQITPIGKTVAGRDLEIVRIGNPDALSRVRPRAGAPVGIGQQLGRAGPDPAAAERRRRTRRFLRVYSVTVLPMANKDGVARGGRASTCAARISIATGTSRRIPSSRRRTRRSSVAGSGDRRRPRPHLALELHNDGNGPAPHQPPAGAAARSSSRAHGDLRRAAAQQDLVHRRSTNAAFRNSGTLGDGWLERYGIDAAVHEFNHGDRGWGGGRPAGGSLWPPIKSRTAYAAGDQGARVR